MKSPSTPPLNPASLPSGTVIGRWRVVDWAGHGAHSTVYRVVPVDKEHAAPVALKLAQRPGHPRFAREVELLSRLRHSHIPRLWDSGQWSHPSGALYPYLVTDWVEGTTLYAAAEKHPPPPEQVLQWLGQLACALQAVHAQGAVHRDVKGANVLVRLSDRFAFLIDFGSGFYPEAPTLTPPGQGVGTPAYRAPEPALFELQSLGKPSTRWESGPAEDLYALGVTACRLVTGEYPEFTDPWKDAQGVWRMDSVRLPDSLLEVEPPLRTVIERLLSVRPEERGTAAELAEELEQAAQPHAPALPRSASAGVPSSPSVLADSRASPKPWRRWFVTAAAGVVLATSAWCVLTGLSELLHRTASIIGNEAPVSEQPDAGTSGLAEAVASTSTTSASEPEAPEAIEEDELPEPEDEQARPDSKGRCPHKRQVVLNGACWVVVPFSREECEDNGGHMFNGTCYMAVVPPGRRHAPMSGHSKKRHTDAHSN